MYTTKLAIQINNTHIEEKTVISFLGVQIDNKLNWKAHITQISNKISKSIAILRFLRYCYPQNVLKMIYMSLIYSHINYCNLIWGAAEDGIIEPLFLLQKKAIRIITQSHYLEHTAPLFENLKLLTVYQVYKLNCSLFIYKCLKCNYTPEWILFTEWGWRDIDPVSSHEDRSRSIRLMLLMWPMLFRRWLLMTSESVFIAISSQRHACC